MVEPMKDNEREIELAIKKFKDSLITKEEAKRRYGLVDFKVDIMPDKTRIMLNPFVSKTNIIIGSKGRIAYLAGRAKKIRTQKKNTRRLFREAEK